MRKGQLFGAFKISLYLQAFVYRVVKNLPPKSVYYPAGNGNLCTQKQLIVRGFYMTEADKNRIEAFLSKAPCKWAKTYADRAPHWYILVSACPGELKEEFYWFVQAIKDFGYQEKFWSKTFTYLNVGEYKYWSMEQPHEKAILINKAKI